MYHLKGSKWIQPQLELLTLPNPKSKKDVRSFLVYAGYYQRFIENFSKISLRLFKILVKDVEFHWNSNYQIAFQILKDFFLTSPVLREPDWKLPFHISTAASDRIVVGVLGQKEEY